MTIGVPLQMPISDPTKKLIKLTIGNEAGPQSCIYVIKSTKRKRPVPLIRENALWIRSPKKVTKFFSSTFAAQQTSSD